VDLAVNKEICQIKRYESETAGDVDLMLFPFITVANAMVKGIQMFGRAKTAGVVVGAKVPIILISRASSSEEKFNSILLALLSSQNAD
jgi:phosphate butyryltransferase